ncbi:hypothetical protein DHEL01_v212627 [Diaporthe helianthi]|uniref:Uncharacterized protein n=1 Tax=Diaporthe helianthi TaxID=158607 RepID=A0A2P5HFE7_DIAHE|nr:hypothetical protein DHEL01_v212627 [Diaporthe helianthi]
MQFKNTFIIALGFAAFGIATPTPASDNALADPEAFNEIDLDVAPADALVERSPAADVQLLPRQGPIILIKRLSEIASAAMDVVQFLDRVDKTRRRAYTDRVANDVYNELNGDWGIVVINTKYHCPSGYYYLGTVRYQQIINEQDVTFDVLAIGHGQSVYNDGDTGGENMSSALLLNVIIFVAA